MRKVDRLWDWLLPGLISLSPSGAIAYYYDAGPEEKAPRYESTVVARHAMPPAALRPAAVIRVGRL